MNVDVKDALVNMEEKPNSRSRQIQIQGRVDVPNAMLEYLGLDHDDRIILSVNDEKDCIEIHDQRKMEKSMNGG